MVKDAQGYSFIEESNKIEGIIRDPSNEELLAFSRFLARDEIKIKDIIEFINVYQPDAQLRDREGPDT